MAEVDDRELLGLRGAKKLLDELITNPKTKRDTQKGIHTLHPTEYTPEPDLLTKEETEKLVEAALEKQKKLAERESLERNFQQTITHYRLSESNPDGYTEEGIQKILELMKERTIPDFDAGVLLFEKLNPGKPELPSGYKPAGWNFGSRTDEDRKLLFEDEDAWLEKEAKSVWEEERRKGAQGS